MIFILMINGIAMWALASTMAAQSFSPILIFNRRVSLFLACFAGLNGTFVFVQTLQFIESRGVINATPIQLDKIAIFLLPLSFLCLFGFGSELLITLGRWKKMTRALYVLIPLDVGSSFLFLGGFQGWLESKFWVPGVEHYTRLLLILPACVVSALSLWLLSDSLTGEGRRRIRMSLKISAGALVAYGISSSAIKFSTPELVNSFADPLHPEHMILSLVPIAALRTVLAVILTLLLCDALFVEVVRDFLLRRKGKLSPVG